MTTRDLDWWYWFLTVWLLAAGLFVWPAGILLAIVLCAVQLAHVIWLTQDLTAFPVQVRAAYGIMLVAGLWASSQWLHWMQLVGTTARVAAGYCFLARTLSLAPWNRWQPLSIDLIRRTYLSVQTVLPPCGKVFCRMSLERVQG